jgi:plastocyanin
MKRRACAPFLILTMICGSLYAAGSSSATSIVVKVFDTHGDPVADAVIFDFATKESTFTPPVQPYEMDQIDKEYVPHLLPILVGGQVRFPNKDDIHHDLYSFSPAKTFEIPLYKGEPAQPVLFDKPGVVQLGCNIHDWMSGIILVLPNPTFAKTEANGKATLSQFPSTPELTLAVFHERLVGKVEETVKTIQWSSYDGKPLIWKISLKPDHPKKRHLTDY